MVLTSLLAACMPALNDLKIGCDRYALLCGIREVGGCIDFHAASESLVATCMVSFKASVDPMAACLHFRVVFACLVVACMHF